MCMYDGLAALAVRVNGLASLGDWDEQVVGIPEMATGAQTSIVIGYLRSLDERTTWKV